jgi:hypothetical protein
MTVLVACGKQDDLDLIAPTLSITSPTPGSSFSTNRTVTIEGETSDDATVVEATLNDVAVPGADISLTGTTFTINVTLVDNANNIVVKVSDDAGNNRSLTFTLYFPQLSIPNGADAALVLGQADFTSNAPNQGGTVGASTLSGVTGTLFKRNNTVLYVPDGGNHRILGFNNTESTTNESADIVIGQANFTSSDTGTSATRFDTPTGVYATDSQFFVADKGNHRVLIWDSIPNNGSVEASTVIGQTDLTSNNMNCTPSTLNAPSSVFVVDGKVIVADNGNNRVLIYNAIPDTNGVAADLVLGQQNLNTCQPNDSDGDGATDTLSGATLSSPGGIWTDGARLLIADTGNNRVLVWDDLSTVTTGQAADHVLGQADMTSDVIEPLPSDSGLNNPLSVTSNGNQIFVADSGNHRVLGWNAFPTTTDKPVADSVIGQSDFSTNTTGATAGLMTTYDNVFVANEGVYVVDGNRVLRFSEPQ